MPHSNRTIPSYIPHLAAALILAAALPACTDPNPSDKQTSPDSGPQTQKTPSAPKAALSKPRAKGDPFTLLTCNVLAEDRSLVNSPRIDALLKLLQHSTADIIVLQEVTPWFLNRLQNAEWTRPYNFTVNKGYPFAPGGLHIMAKFPIANTVSRALPSSIQGRGVLVLDLAIDGRQLAVATVHLDSFLKSGPIRAKQLDTVWKLLKSAPNAILAGDYNFGDGEQPETRHLDPRYIDAWTTHHPNQPGYTWNMEQNILAKTGAFKGEESRRLDRLMIRSNHWHATSITIIGNTPLKGTPNQFPSDHFGLLTTIAPRK